MVESVLDFSQKGGLRVVSGVCGGVSRGVSGWCLEDQGGDGTALTHWEKRIFQNEAMTGTVHSSAPVYSRLTLALLEDSGWYLTDYSRAQPLAWGAGAGCHFATKSCMELLQDRGTPFCSALMQSGEKVRRSLAGL